MTVKIIISSTIFLLTIVSGIWLSKLGKPYSQLVFNIHKLIALGFLVFTFIIAKNLFQNIEPGFLKLSLLVFIAISVVSILVSGAFLSFNEQVNNFIALLHKISSVILLLSITAWFYLGIR